MSKSEQMLKMIVNEMDNYDSLYEKIGNAILDAQNKLANCKAELVEAKRIRKNKCEYDSLANVINNHANRSDTMTRLQQLEQQIKQLQQTKNEMERKLERRRSEFGFVDAFNESKKWYAKSYIAIDVGPVIGMIENYRTGLICKLFMSCTQVLNGLKRRGFQD